MDQTAFTLAADDLPEIAIDDTPVPTETARELNGVWRFAAGDHSSPPAASADWRRHRVPGQWNHAGYEVPGDGRGWYRREFAVPSDWAGDRIRLRFEAVYSDAVVLVNGERVGSHEGGYTPFEVDVSEAVTPGSTARLTVGVAEHSPAGDLGQWSLGGGITRPVTLFAVPPVHLRSLAVETTLADDADRATVTAGATVRNESETVVEEGSLAVALTGPDGTTVATGSWSLDAPVPPGGRRRATLELAVEAPATWDPERPRLHDLEFDCTLGGHASQLSERVGIREVNVAGDQLLLNGESATLRGVNYRECHPSHGQAMPPDLAREDAERFRAANVNYVRTGHHPPSRAFVEACDELGIVLEMEAPIAGVRFSTANRATDPQYRELLCRQILETVVRDRTAPSVCIWSLANESEWGPNFEAAARLVEAVDPTRPKTFNWGMHLTDDVGFCEVTNHHYPALRDSKVSLEEFDDIDRPVLFGEFAHLYCYNGPELGADPGLRDDYGRLFERAWERVCRIDAFAGAAIWAGVDHTEPEYRWGLLDAHRRRRPEYWHVKKVYAPVQLTDVEYGEEEVAVTLENRMTFADLSTRTLEWTAGDTDGTIAVSAAPGASGRATIPRPPDDEPLELAVRDPRGFAVNRWTLRPDVSPQPAGGRSGGRAGTVTGAASDDVVSPPGPPPVPETAGPVDIETGPHRFRQSVGETTLEVDRHVGTVTYGGPDGPVLAGIPGVVATEPESVHDRPLRYLRATDHRLGPWRCEDVSPSPDGERIEISGGYYYDTIDVAHGTFTFSLRSDGHLDVGYEFAVTGDRSARELGVALPAPRALDTLSWERSTRWTAYPPDHVGRPAGTARAAPSGDLPSDDPARLDPTRPWRHDVTGRGSNDFRSAKRHVRTATLAGGGRGLTAVCGGDQHVRAAVLGESVDLLILETARAGVGLGLLDRHGFLGESTELPAGSTLSGTATVRLAEDAGR